MQGNKTIKTEMEERIKYYNTGKKNKPKGIK